jgi:hypothetical protein
MNGKVECPHQEEELKTVGLVFFSKYPTILLWCDAQVAALPGPLQGICPCDTLFLELYLISFHLRLQFT